MHLIEVERKRAVADAASLRDRLAALGYRGDRQVTETDVYYSRPDVDYMQTVECLRVRRRADFCEITYKPPSNPGTHGASHIIAKREINVALAGIENSDAARALLEAVGMRELAVVEKNRHVFCHPDRDDTVIALDSVTGAGEFVETEVSATDQHDAATHLKQIERELGIDTLPVVTLPYRDLVMMATR
ncbi:class IV adenylate cyclase [Nocardia africana]|uniref:Putative adenylyl cyclase CyaB n=1 Tax=Nocardia africana TaxID=134964 RepID=A0A378WZN9_9NOCA|nr:class IV adenylate cyclase [Nocardia africana]MCC3312437.1 class IV adenylate cyclase [Nocardia africana]SUA46247.1 putative adenylyl cyclase CyaB [Nocardia africana]